MNIARSVKDLLATVRHWIENAKSIVEPQSEGEVEALAGMSVNEGGVTRGDRHTEELDRGARRKKGE